MIAQLVVGLAGGVLLALLMSLIPVAAVVAIGVVVVTTWIQLARKRERIAMLAGATLGSGLALLLMVTTTVQSCSQTSDFCGCLLYTSPSPRDRTRSRMPSSA